MEGKVSCLGPDGSYSVLAAKTYCAGCEFVLCRSFYEAVDALCSKACDYAVLPVENSLNGGVLPVLDLLSERDISAIEEHLVPIDHRLALLEGVSLSDIRTVYSHEQALAQCAEFLRTRLPEARLVRTSSTSESLENLGAHEAGIVGSHIKKEGVVLSEENIADNKQNYTRFLTVQRGSLRAEHSAMVFLCAVCAHTPGSLLGLLKIFRRYELNLTRIESRPMKEAFGQYRFFVEFAGDIGTDRVQKALREAEAYCSQFKLLGAYG